MEKNEIKPGTGNFKETLEYNLDYAGERYSVQADCFELALGKLSKHLKVDIKENQVRIGSVIKIKVAC